jgi:hypothetical protein
MGATALASRDERSVAPGVKPRIDDANHAQGVG